MTMLGGLGISRSAVIGRLRNVAAGATGTIYLFDFLGDSNSYGRGPDPLSDHSARTADDPAITGGQQWINTTGAPSPKDTWQPGLSPIYSSDTVVPSLVKISPAEDLGRDLIARGYNIAIVHSGKGGTTLATGWNSSPLGTNLDAARIAHNAALAQLKVENPNATIIPVIVFIGGANDANGGTPTSETTFKSAELGMIDYIRANFTDCSAATKFFMASTPAGGAAHANVRLWTSQNAINRDNVFYNELPYPTADTSNLHSTRVEYRAYGAELGGLFHSTITAQEPIPTFTNSPTQSVTVGDALELPINHTGLTNDSPYGVAELNGGANVGSYSITGVWPNQVLNITPATAGDYVVNLRIRNNAGQFGPNFTLTTTASAAGMTSPTSFFTSAERGIVWDLSDLASLSQDKEGTIPVTAAGQVVGRIADKSINGFHWLANANDTTRPTYQVDAEGKPYLQFDGTNDQLFAQPVVQTVIEANTGQLPFSGVIGVNARTAANAVYTGTSKGVFAEGQTGTATIFEIGTNTSSAGRHVYRNDASGGGATYGNVANMFDGNKRVFTFRSAGWGNNVNNRKAIDRPAGGGSGGYSTTNIPNSGGANFTLLRSALGSRGQFSDATTPLTGNCYGGRIYSGFVMNRDMTNAEVKAAEDWVASRMAVTLP